MTWLALLTPQLEFPGSTPDSSFVLYKVLDVLLELSKVGGVVAIVEFEASNLELELLPGD